LGLKNKVQPDESQAAKSNEKKEGEISDKEKVGPETV
jgi:hypothetical protein